MDANTLHDILAPVCPLSGVTVEIATEPVTWSFQPDQSATTSQIDAATTLLQTLTPSSVPAPSVTAVAVGSQVANLITQADALNAAGNSYDAVKLLLQAHGVST